MHHYPKREGGLSAWKEDVLKACPQPAVGNLIFVWGEVYRCMRGTWPRAPKYIWNKVPLAEQHRMWRKATRESFSTWKHSLNKQHHKQNRKYKDE